MYISIDIDINQEQSELTPHRGMTAHGESKKKTDTNQDLSACHFTVKKQA
jgi:hypothetical protein